MRNRFFILVALIFIATAAHAQSCIWTDNPKGPSCSILPQKSGLHLGDVNHPWGSFTVDSSSVVGTLTASAFDLTDGSDKNYEVGIVGAGTAYALTNTAAAVVLGTTSPVVVLNKAGTYLITANVTIAYVGATFAADRAVTIKLRRTNNTAADLTGGSAVLGTNIVTTVNGTFERLSITVPYQTTTSGTSITDSITLFGDVAVVPTAGALSVTQASITAVRLF